MRNTNEQEVDWLQLVLGKVLAAGVDVDTRFADRKAATPLMLAARTGNLLVLKALLNAGADPRCEQWSPKGRLFCPTLALHLSIHAPCCWHCASLIYSAVPQVTRQRGVHGCNVCSGLQLVGLPTGAGGGRGPAAATAAGGRCLGGESAQQRAVDFALPDNIRFACASYLARSESPQQTIVC